MIPVNVVEKIKKQIWRCVIPVGLSSNKNKLNGRYVYRHKHNYIPYSTFTITKLQLHVSAINVGHLQDVHEELFNINIDKFLMYNLKMANIDGRNM